MEKLLLSNNLRCFVGERQELLMNTITKEIFNSIFGALYQEEDIHRIYFNHIGHPKTIALYICVTLKFKESKDVIDDIYYKLRNNLNTPGLSFLSVYPNGIISNYTEYNFWYHLSEDELKWF